MKLKNIAILLALTGLLPLAALATPATSDDAQLVAAGWTAANATFGSLGNVVSVNPELSSSGEMLWYRVTMDRGSVIVSPDTEIEPVIAVVPGLVDEIAEDSPLRAMLLRDLPARLKSVPVVTASGTTGGLKFATAPSKNAAKWAKYKSTGAGGVKPKMLVNGNPATIVNWLDGWNSPNTVDGVQTLRFWNQQGSGAYFTNHQIFNLYTPDNDPCGCVATAGASVMHYFRVPYGEQIPRECRVDGDQRRLTSYGGPYNWSLIDNLNLTRGSPITLSPEQVELLGRVAYDCGVGCGMSYSAGASGSFSYNLMQSFRDVFNIKNAQLVTKSGNYYGQGEKADIGPENYAKIIYNQIRAGAPVVLGIDGHEVVACGYGYDGDGTDYTYVFMGWGGSNDAWYALPIIGDTQATVGGGTYTSKFIDELITEISPDEKFVAVVGRVVDLDGFPIDNYEGLTLTDGTPIEVNDDGYWGVRVAPERQIEIVDALGEGHRTSTLGDFALKTTTRGVASAALAQALPDEMEIKVDTAVAGFLRVHTNLEKAHLAAWQSGKLLYLIGGTNEAAIAEWKDERRKDVDNIYTDFKNSHIIVEVLVEDYPNLVSGDFYTGAFDPRVFDPAGDWSAENGLRADDAEAWDAVDRRPTALALSGPSIVSTVEKRDYTYEATITFADGLEIVLPEKFAVWGKDDPAGILMGCDKSVYTTNNNKKSGSFKVLVANLKYGEIELSAEKEVTAGGRNAVIPKASNQNDFLLTEASSALAKKYKRNIAEKAFNQPGARALSGQPGDTIYASVKPTHNTDGSSATEKYKFACVGYELYKDGELVETGTRADMREVTVVGEPAGTYIGFPIYVDTTDIVVKWTWVEAAISVHITGSHNVGISESAQLVVAGETLTVKATPPGGENLTTGSFVWKGAYPREILDEETAGIVAYEPREVVVDWMKTGSTFVSPDSAEVYTTKPGYCVEEVGRTSDGQYLLQVVKAEVEEAEATVRIVYPDETIKYFDRVDHAFADVRGPCAIELLADQEPTQVMRVYEDVVLRTADAALAKTITRQAGRFLVDTGATLTVTNVTVKSPLFEVNGGALTLQDQTTLTGADEEGVETAAVVVRSAGSFAMEEGSAIEGCRNIAARQEHKTAYPEGPDGGVTNKVTVVFSTGLAGGLLLDGGSTAALRGGRIIACEGGTGGGIVALGDSKLDISGDFVVAGNMARETVYEWTTTLIHDPEDDADPTAPDYEPVMIPYDYISGFHQVVYTNNLTMTSAMNCRLTTPLTDEAEIGRYTSRQADTNLVAAIPAWQGENWDLTTLTNTAARCRMDGDTTICGAVVTNAAAKAYVVWSTAIDPKTGFVTLANGDVCRALTWQPPETAEPEPIAFSMIQMNDDNSVVTLGITNAVKWCNYAVYGTNTLIGGFVIEGTTPVTNFQWKSTAREIKLELPTNGNLFWRATAAEGLIEE